MKYSYGTASKLELLYRKYFNNGMRRKKKQKKTDRSITVPAPYPLTAASQSSSSRCLLVN